jgi:hypothetical protein
MVKTMVPGTFFFWNHFQCKDWKDNSLLQVINDLLYEPTVFFDGNKWGQANWFVWNIHGWLCFMVDFFLGIECF